MTIVITEQGAGANPLLQKIKLVKGDICAQRVDAILTVMPQKLDLKGRLNTRIFEKGGAGLLQELKDKIRKPKAGEVFVLDGHDLAAKSLILVITPNWRTGFDHEERVLSAAIKKALAATNEHHLKTLAIPPLLSGQQRFPKNKAMRLIVNALADALTPDHGEVQLVAQRAETLKMFRKRLIALGWVSSL